MWVQFCFMFNMQSGSRDSKTCSEEKPYWLIPGYSEVEYKEIEDIDFSEPETIKKTE